MRRHTNHTNERSRRKPHHTQGREGGARCARANNYTDGGGGCGCFSLFLVCGVVFYVSVLLCGARVLDDVRREAQAGQRTRKARSQVLPCKPRYWAYACLRKDLQEKKYLPEKGIMISNYGNNFAK